MRHGHLFILFSIIYGRSKEWERERETRQYRRLVHDNVGYAFVRTVSVRSHPVPRAPRTSAASGLHQWGRVSAFPPSTAETRVQRMDLCTLFPLLRRSEKENRLRAPDYDVTDTAIRLSVVLSVFVCLCNCVCYSDERYFLRGCASKTWKPKARVFSCRFVFLFVF